MRKPNTTISIRKTTRDRLRKLRKIVAPSESHAAFVDAMSMAAMYLTNDQWALAFLAARKGAAK